MLVLDLGVRKATAADITALHARQLAGARLVDGVLTFPDAGWDSRYLGRGEEKAVYAVSDGDGHVFAVELIDERSYLNGRFVTGEYFLDLRPRGLGRVKVREFADGYEWGRFQWRPDRRSSVDHLLTAWLRLFLSGQYVRYMRRHRDVHERNVLFEVHPWKHGGVPVLVRSWSGALRLARVRLAPVDVR